MYTNDLDIPAIDADGAVREAADAVAGDTRLDFLRKAGLGAGALMSGGAVLAALAPDALAGAGAPPASFGRGNVGILNYALTLEYLESSFYNEAVASGAIKDPALLALAHKVKLDENAHVKFLLKALGSKAVKKPKFNFGTAVSDETMFAETSLALENTGVTAYQGQAFNIKGNAYVADALSIWAVEARHAGAIGFYLDMKSTAKVANEVSPQGAFQHGRTAAQVLSVVKGTHFITG